MQHVNVKIFAARADFDLSELVPIFHRWIQDRVCPELLIDVADYKHVPDGPGVMLIGHEADYSMDNIGGRIGLLYNRKVETDGDTLRQAYDAALSAARMLEADPALSGRLHFDESRVQILLNDRLLFPNTAATFDEVRPKIERFFAALWGEGRFSIERYGEPRDRFTVEVVRR